MTRDEEILNAARTRAERHQIAEMELYGGDKCNYSYGRIYFSEIASFEAGAKWADQHPNNVWHDASEEPKEDVDILFISKNGKVHKVSKIDLSLYDWLKDNDGIDKWAYINDLLPKQFGNSKQLKGE